MWNDSVSIGDLNVGEVNPVNFSYCISGYHDARPTFVRVKAMDLAMKVFHIGESRPLGPSSRISNKHDVQLAVARLCLEQLECHNP